MNKELEKYVSKKIKDFLKSSKIKYENLKIEVSIDDKSYSVDFLLDYNGKRMCYLDLADENIIDDNKFEKEVIKDIVKRVRSANDFEHGKVNKITLTESVYNSQISTQHSIFESVRFLNESKHDIIISVDDIAVDGVSEAEAAQKIKKVLSILERNGMLTNEGSKAIRSGETSITKGMVNILYRNTLKRLINTIIETPSKNMETVLNTYIKEIKQEGEKMFKNGLALGAVANGGGFAFSI